MHITVIKIKLLTENKKKVILIHFDNAINFSNKPECRKESNCT